MDASFEPFLEPFPKVVSWEPVPKVILVELVLKVGCPSRNPNPSRR